MTVVYQKATWLMNDFDKPSGSCMKIRIFCIAIFFLPWLCIGQGFLYSLSGSVSRLYYDGGGILAAQNVTVGEPTSVSFIVDFGAPGYYLLNDGTVQVAADPPTSSIFSEYFYCALASGTLLPDANGGFNNRPQDVAEYFTGWNRSDSTGNEGLLWGGSGNSYFSVYKDSNLQDCFVQNWQVGTEVQGSIIAFSDSDWSIAWTDMTLESITIVPEPSTSLLLMICIGTWHIWSRRKASIAEEP